MAEVKLQYSVICEDIQGLGFINIIHGFRIGKIKNFYIVNKWIWDDVNEIEDGFYQRTGIIYNNEILAISFSDLFKVRAAHTHQNLFRDINFQEEGNYRIRVELFDQNDRLINKGSIEYPVFVRG